MPLYDYKCLDCKKEFEIKLSLEKKEKNKRGEYEVECPGCKSKNTEGLVTGGHSTLTGVFSK